MRRIAVFMNVPDDMDDTAVATFLGSVLQEELHLDPDLTVFSKDEDVRADMEAGEEATGHFAAHSQTA